MIIHLESGSCESGICATDLNIWAAECYQWRHYIDRDYREDLLDGVDIQLEYGPAYPFHCPTCGSDFSRLSGLFQHVTTQSCTEDLESRVMGKLRWWLEVRKLRDFLKYQLNHPMIETV